MLGSPLGPVMVNTFMCSNEGKLEREGVTIILYKRYVDDTLTAVKDNLLFQKLRLSWQH